MTVSDFLSTAPPPRPRLQVLDQLAAFSAGKGAGTQVLLLPSVKDVHHHPVFPQPPFALAQPGVRGLPSPATLRCGRAGG